jgi:hypothetical protein
MMALPPRRDGQLGAGQRHLLFSLPATPGRHCHDARSAPRRQPSRRVRADFWSGHGPGVAGRGAVLLVWPIVQVLQLGFVDPETQRLHAGQLHQGADPPYYLGALGTP